MGNELCPLASRCIQPCRPMVREATGIGKDKNRGEHGASINRREGVFARSVKGSDCPPAVAKTLRAIASGRR